MNTKIPSLSGTVLTTGAKFLGMLIALPIFMASLPFVAIGLALFTGALTICEFFFDFKGLKKDLQEANNGR